MLFLSWSIFSNSFFYYCLSWYYWRCFFICLFCLYISTFFFSLWIIAWYTFFLNCVSLSHSLSNHEDPDSLSGVQIILIAISDIAYMYYNISMHPHIDYIIFQSFNVPNILINLCWCSCFFIEVFRLRYKQYL